MGNVIQNVEFLLMLFVLIGFFPVKSTADNGSVTVNSSKYAHGEPLFLTRYIESGDIDTGRSLSRVGQLPNAPTVTSYSGFFTVNKEYNSNLFFWFFPALNKDVNSPIILWLQGGPGLTDLVGLFLENGPYEMHSNTTVGLRNHTWAKEFHVLYVDDIVGTGFSFTDNEKGYPTNQDQVTDDLYTFTKQFFEVFYEYRRNDLYICSESYGGKHGPYLAYKMHTDGAPAEVNLKGISVGNGVIDVHILKGLDNYLFQLGIVDSKQASIFKHTFDLMERHLKEGEYFKSVQEMNKIFNILSVSDVATTGYLESFSGYHFPYNFLQIKKPDDYFYYTEYIVSPKARKAIHVGNLTFFNVGEKVQHYLLADTVVSSARDKIAFLLDHYKVLIYNGQLDLLCPYVITNRNFIQKLTWKHSDEYKAADRKIWRLNNQEQSVAGYVNSGGNLFFVLVRNAGHVLPRDQPEFALDLITRFIKDIPYA